MKDYLPMVKAVALSFAVLVIVAFSFALLYNYASADTNFNVEEDGLISCSWASNPWNSNRTMACDNYDASNNSNSTITLGNTQWDTRRAQFLYDTSTLDDTEIATATIDFTFNYWQSGAYEQSFYVIAGDSMPAWDYTDLSNPDFTSFGTCNFDDPSDNEKITCDLNASGIAHIDNDGDTVFALVQDMDFNNATGDYYIGWIYSSEFSNSRGSHLNIGYADAEEEPEPEPVPVPEEEETCASSTWLDINAMPYTSVGWDVITGAAPSFESFVSSSTYTIYEISIAYDRYQAQTDQDMVINIMEGKVSTTGCSTGSWGRLVGNCELKWLNTQHWYPVDSVGTTTVTLLEPLVIKPEQWYTIGIGASEYEEENGVKIKYHLKTGTPFSGGIYSWQGAYPNMTYSTDRDLAFIITNKDCAINSSILTEEWLNAYTPTINLPHGVLCRRESDCKLNAWFNKQADNFFIYGGWCDESATSTVCIRHPNLANATGTTDWTGTWDDGSGQFDEKQITLPDEYAPQIKKMWVRAYNIATTSIANTVWSPGDYLIDLGTLPVSYSIFSLDETLCNSFGGAFCTPIASTCDNLIMPATTTNSFGFPTFEGLLYSGTCALYKFGAFLFKPNAGLLDSVEEELNEVVGQFPLSVVWMFADIVRRNFRDADIITGVKGASVPLLMPDGSIRYLITPARWDEFEEKNPELIYWYFKIIRTIFYGLLMYWFIKRISTLLRVPEGTGNVFIKKGFEDRRTYDRKTAVWYHDTERNSRAHSDNIKYL